MFNGASSFNQDLCNWYSNSEVTSASNFCANGATCLPTDGCPTASPSSSSLPSSIPRLSTNPSAITSLKPSLLPSSTPSLSTNPSSSSLPTLQPTQCVVGDKFQTTSELKSEVSTYCSDPSTYDTTKYG